MRIKFKWYSHICYRNTASCMASYDRVYLEMWEILSIFEKGFFDSIAPDVLSYSSQIHF